MSPYPNNVLSSAHSSRPGRSCSTARTGRTRPGRAVTQMTVTTALGSEPWRSRPRRVDGGQQRRRRTTVGVTASRRGTGRVGRAGRSRPGDAGGHRGGVARLHRQHRARALSHRYPVVTVRAEEGERGRRAVPGSTPAGRVGDGAAGVMRSGSGVVGCRGNVSGFHAVLWVVWLGCWVGVWGGCR